MTVREFINHLMEAYDGELEEELTFLATDWDHPDKNYSIEIGDY